jgi:hypothetical protein
VRLCLGIEAAAHARPRHHDELGQDSLIFHSPGQHRGLVKQQARPNRPATGAIPIADSMELEIGGSASYISENRNNEY